MQLLQHVVDERAASQPDEVIYVVPRSEKSVDEGFEDVTTARLANAVNRAAAWVQSKVQGPPGQSLAFIAPQDIRYFVFILGANKAGHRLLLLSPRNGDDAQRHLLGVAKCRYFLCGHQYEKSSRRIIDSADGAVQALVIPEVRDILDEAKVDAFPFDREWADERHKPLVALHTSGTSTGKPKPIVLNHGYYAIDELLPKFPKIDGRPLQLQVFTKDLRNLHAMPLFHVGALFMAFFKPILQSGTIVLLPGDTQIEADMVIRTLTKAHCNQIGTSPTIIENLITRADGRAALEKLDRIGFGSGPMAVEVGDALLKLNSNSVNLYGATEMNMLPVIRSDDPVKDWQYARFHPWSGVTFEPIGGDESMCELVIKPSKYPAHEALQPAFENWPQTDEYRSKDVFVRHPTKADFWRWYSRVDDVITFETGEKLNPSTMEAIITTHPKVKAAVVIGQRRMQPALLIELVDHSSNHRELLEDIWPTVQKANAEAPTYGQLVKQLILFTEEPFSRTPKGTIQRTKTEELLAEEIAHLYEGGGESVYSTPLDPTSQQSVQEFVSSIVHDILSLPTEFDDSTNLFDCGLDSLKAAELVRALNGVLRKHLAGSHAPARIDVSTIYSDPTIKTLSTTFFELANHGGHATDENSWNESAKRLFARHVPMVAKGAALLTGSTGSLGAHLLHLLLHDETYSHVYCLNRSPTAQKGYLETFPSDSKLMHKATFLQTSTIWSPFFGIADGQFIFRELLSNVRTVIHNAWPVNFLMAVEASNPGAYSSSFEPQLDGVSNLIRFCAESRHNARFVYISSLSSVMSGAIKPVPEAIVTDATAPGIGGYPRSKWITECIMEAVARENPGTVSQPVVIRPGQISGPLEQSVEKGATGVGSKWNAREAMASLFISSAAVGALPESIGHEEKLRWVPVDIVAKTTLEVIAHVDRISPGRSINRSGASAYNVINIQETEGKEVTWSSMIPVIRARLEKKLGRSVPSVPMGEWIQMVEAFGPGDGKENPAFKLQDFMGSLAVSSADDGMGTQIETKLTKEASKSLRDLSPVQSSWIEFWMQGWGL